MTYVGRYQAVEIETAPQRWRRVRKGETVQVSDRAAASLLEQDAWADPDAVDDVPAGTVAEVLAWVDSNPDRARAALDAERAGKGRKTLLDDLEQLAAGTSGDLTDGAASGAQEG